MAEKFNKDELVAPTWLDKSFFARALRSHRRDASIEVKDVTLKPGTAAGEHYASIMFKATVEYSSVIDGDDATLKVILKTMPQVEGQKMEFLKNSPAFQNESMVYATILPEMERLLRVAGDSTVFAPPLVYQNMHTEKSPVIVLEDISPDGFITFKANVNEWDQVELITQKLAKFHALSMYMNENVRCRKVLSCVTHFCKFFVCILQGFPLTKLNDHYQCDKNMVEMFVRPAFNNLLGKLKDWEGFERFYKKLHDKFEYNMERISKLIREHSGFCVLNHGDFHMKNMMFRNEGLKDEDIIFVRDTIQLSLDIELICPFCRWTINSHRGQRPLSILRISLRCWPMIV